MAATVPGGPADRACLWRLLTLAGRRSRTPCQRRWQGRRVLGMHAGRGIARRRGSAGRHERDFSTFTGMGKGKGKGFHHALPRERAWVMAACLRADRRAEGSGAYGADGLRSCRDGCLAGLGPMPGCPARALDRTRGHGTASERRRKARHRRRRHRGPVRVRPRAPTGGIALPPSCPETTSSLDFHTRNSMQAACALHGFGVFGRDAPPRPAAPPSPDGEDRPSSWEYHVAGGRCRALGTRHQTIDPLNHAPVSRYHRGMLRYQMRGVSAPRAWMALPARGGALPPQAL